MKVLSLFSGIGAFEKALDNLGVAYELTAFSEIDKHAVKSYCAIHNVDESKNLGDITKINESTLPQNIDLVTYGFPCQDISLAGKQKGLFNDDGTQTRSGLFFDALRIITSTKPMVAIAENVKNLTSNKFADQFKIVLQSLEEAGYNNYWQVLNAKDYGIPQNRERVFIVSIRKDTDNCVFKFPDKKSLTQRMKDIVEKDVPESYFLTNKQILSIAHWNAQQKPFKRVLGKNSISHTLTARGAGEYHSGMLLYCDELETTTDIHEQCLHINNEENFRKLRFLTEKECFRLTGFCDIDFVKASSVCVKRQLYKQAGNSIVVPVVERIIEAIFDCGLLKTMQ